MRDVHGGLPADARVVIVGASLAGLRTAEALRDVGHDGPITVIGDEEQPPYDRPPLSKQVPLGFAPARKTGLPRLRNLDGVEWLLGVAATGLDRGERQVALADGRRVDYDRVVVATGVRSRPWPVAEEGALDGVISVRTSGDAEQLHALLADKPRRVLVIGGGFTGSEIASVCRQLGLEVTLVERGTTPLGGALGDVIGEIAADLQRGHGVDLRTGVEVGALEGDGRIRQVPARPPITDLAPSPALSIVANGPETFAGRKLGVLVTDGTDATLLEALRKAATSEGALVELIAPWIGGVRTSDGALIPAHQHVAGGPSVLYDAVAILASAEGATALAADPAAKDFVTDAHAHGKFIAYDPASVPLLEAAGVARELDDGYVALERRGAVTDFIERSRSVRYWQRSMRTANEATVGAVPS